MKALLVAVLFLSSHGIVFPQQVSDERVKAFLDDHRGRWNDLNVPYEDGKVLYDIILKNKYKSGLEIGTSTGHSTIWIAWALSKTGGKLITLEIDEDRRKEAMQNLKEVGLAHIVDSRLGNAHDLVKELPGPFDFVFSDADKNWYTQYFKDIEPKLEVGGCFTAHNVRNNFGGTEEFMDYVNAQDNFETTVDKTSRSGISVSYKRKQ